MINLNGKIIVITGGSGLLGRNFVSVCRNVGATCINADINCNDNLNDFQIHIDIADESSVACAVKKVVERFGRIDGWVNNAYPRTDDWACRPENLPADSWRKNIDLHLNGYYLCCAHAIKVMSRQFAGGSILNIASIYGVVAPDFTVYSGTALTSPIAYAAIKGGIIQLSKYLASYYGPKSIRVNCLSPGGIFDGQNETFVENYNKRVPVRRMGTPEDLAGGLVYLLSDSSRYVTGQNLVIDGGWTAI
jgi:NAD(P)-dependent dehydrogenase (short-subunit alcohol dehydrogenase family)